MQQPKRFVMMAGGTGGHVFPALAVARALQSEGGHVDWLGSVNSMEERIIGESDIPFYGLRVKGLRGNGLLQWLLAPFKLCAAVVGACRVMVKLKPHAVMGMGGFASGPGGLAARLMGKPLIIHEQNAIAGMTNRILSRWAALTLAGFPGAFDGTGDQRVRVVGNPVRQEIQPRPKKDTVDKSDSQTEPLHILVLGGSLGAKALNEELPNILSGLSNQNIRVWHQCGRGKLEQVEQSYEQVAFECRLEEFIDDMAVAYKWADFVICRAGAITVAELCVSGLAAVFIPYPYAVDDHQTHNARFMVEAGAAHMVQQHDLNQALPPILEQMVSRPQDLGKMSGIAQSLGKPEATELAASACWEVASRV